MSLWVKIKQTLRSFMNGRHGADQLNLALLWLGIGLYALGALLGLGFLTLLSAVPYAVCFFRMFSRNQVKRYEENRKYLLLKNRQTTKWKQARTRFRQRKQFKYFKCPNCRAWLKLPRGSGVVTVTCGKCQNSFTQKG